MTWRSPKILSAMREGDEMTDREMLEMADTETLFSNPADIRTENYITGRFG